MRKMRTELIGRQYRGSSLFDALQFNSNFVKIKWNLREFPQSKQKWSTYQRRKILFYFRWLENPNDITHVDDISTIARIRGHSANKSVAIRFDVRTTKRPKNSKSNELSSIQRTYEYLTLNAFFLSKIRSIMCHVAMYVFGCDDGISGRLRKSGSYWFVFFSIFLQIDWSDESAL